MLIEANIRNKSVQTNGKCVAIIQIPEAMGRIPWKIYNWNDKLPMSQI